MEIISVRAQPGCADAAIAFLQQAWGGGNNEIMYEDCVRHCLGSPSPLPQWYLLRDGETLAGCAGLIPNDFISRMDLWPWICALYVAREHLENAIILDGDQIIYHPEILAPEFERSGYNSVWTDDETDEWLQTVENGIVTGCSRTGGKGGWQLYSISRWTAEDGKRLKGHLEQEFEVKKNRQIYVLLPERVSAWHPANEGRGYHRSRQFQRACCTRCIVCGLRRKGRK